MNTSATIIEVIDEWMQNLDVMETTRTSYRTKVQLWFRWLAAQRVDPRCPARRHILAWKQALEQQGRSALTVDGYVTAVRMFYKYCAARGYYSDIGSGVRSSVRYRGHRKGRLTSEEAARLLDSVDVSTFKGKRDRLMLAMMLLLALRTCEVERVNIDDFDFTEEGVPVLYIQRKGRHEKVEALALPDTIVELLSDFISVRGARPGEALFASAYPKNSHRLRRTSISQIVHQRLAAIGIRRPNITAHSLRHTCASLMVESGVDLETVRDMLGHTTTNTTRIYAEEVHARMLIRNTPAKLVEKAIESGRRPGG